MLWPLLLACFDPVTNAPLHEDARFLQALPSAQNLRPPPLPPASETELLNATIQAASQLDQLVEPIVRASEALRGAQPVERSPHHRIFAPTPVVAIDLLSPAEVWWVRGSIIEPQADVFGWTIEAAQELSGPWHVVGDGRATPRESSLSWDLLPTSSRGSDSTLQAQWSHQQDERDTTLALTHGFSQPQHFGLYSTTAMSFSFDDLPLGGEQVAGVALTVHSEQGGRSDGKLSDGRLITQCWNMSGELVYDRLADHAAGSEADCAMERWVDPADW